MGQQSRSCGLFGLLLAATGLHGVVAYSVARRTKEIGVRTALGAQPNDIIEVVMGEGVKIICWGSAAGILSALAARIVISSLISRFATLGSTDFDPNVLVLLPAFLGASILLACYIPARRAANLDPMAALRHE